MAIQVVLHHHTEYRYDRAVTLSPHLVRLRPAPHTRTPLHRYSLNVEPADHFINWQQDPFGNFVARLVFPKKTRRLAVTVELIAELVTINPFDFFVEDSAQAFPFRYETQLAKELAPYFEVETAGPQLQAYLDGVPRQAASTVDYLVELNLRLQQAIGYVVRMEPGIQSCEQTLTLARGSCRDTAWLLVQILRHLGLAARFVSGYLVQLAPDQKSLDGPSGPEADFTDLHAWTEVYLPGAGWVGLDPTSGLFAGEGHIPLSCTPDPVSAAPITGAVDECRTEFLFENRVTRLLEEPRVTRPYSEAQWAAVLALGEAVDAALAAADVRLTLGGEPTFVSIDDMDSAQWNTAALGRHKRERAEDLFRRLWQRFAPGGVLHYGQGKWYPGEALPRWALSCLWRADGKPLWKDSDRLADSTAGGDADAALSAALVHKLAAILGLDPGLLRAGHEDALYYAWREGRLPANLDVFDSRLDDPLERERLRRVFDQGLDRVVGHALPIAWDALAGRWTSSPWRFRRGHMFLLPGDSPMGLRLPLDALYWEPPAQRQPLHERDPYAPRPVLPADFGELHARYARLAVTRPAHPEIQEQPLADGIGGTLAPESLVRTALCVEPRDGVLHVFLPPLTHIEHWLALVSAIEQAATELDTRVVLEGYPAPADERIRQFQVTPDPGVIEVNIQPAHSWRELIETNEALHQEARLARLGTEKFMLDGRHTGTGGGNHITLGGARPADSPMLRRPHLLTSLLRYWQHHPGLSYLFSGLFVGPTSQAPRVDEARDDSLYELEIALAQLAPGESASPWRVDRVLRNLLVDLTGNTHRAEFCIDKLYSPDAASGRKGLVEFRGFEMPPHPRMSGVQMLLLRTLVARFWAHPYSGAPVRWGTELHDRFMLPHYVESDLRDVVADLNRWGYDFHFEWLAPFFEFRFPRYGTVQLGDLELELRAAIEPWHVLGEEATAQGTARFVDSSVERLQVKLRGLTEGRHLVTCNGRRVPLRATRVRSEQVAGVRYKAWQPPSGLHPTLGVHVPLVFDLVDSWNGHSLGGCTYHVSHPSGRNYDTLPVNAYEAESRRLARFEAQGHTPGPLCPPPEEPPGDFPCTLDLRRPPARRTD